MLRYLDKHREEEEQEEPFPESSSQEEHRQCQQWCREEEYDDPQQLKKCRQSCEETLRKREAEEEEEGGDRGGKTRPDPEKELRHCQRRCVRRYGTGQERQICKRTCRKQYDRERGYEGPSDEIDSLEEMPPGKRYEHCRKSCERQSQDQRQQKQCESQCRTEASQKELLEREEENWESNSIVNKDDVPYQRKCEKHKQSESPEMKTKCPHKCEKKRGGSDEKQGQKGKEEKEQREQKQGEKGKETEKKDREQRQKGSESPKEGEEEEKEKNKQKGTEKEEEIIKRLHNNPYYFPSDESQSRFSTQEGQLKVFDMFSEKSEVLQGIESYRLAVLEAGPNTFVIPHHYDAESVLVVVRGNQAKLVRQYFFYHLSFCLIEVTIYIRMLFFLAFQYFLRIHICI